MAHRVYDSTTGDLLHGRASGELVRESKRAIDGIVPAYLRGGTWLYVPPSQRDFFRRIRGENVIHVFLG